jgi:hypothetical protein
MDASEIKTRNFAVFGLNNCLFGSNIGVFEPKNGYFEVKRCDFLLFFS